MSFLSLNNISKSYGSTLAVEDFNLEVERGEFISLLGPSGCGKTTTLQMIAGFEEPSSGSIHINGRDMTSVSPSARDIDIVFQGKHSRLLIEKVGGTIIRSTADGMAVRFDERLEWFVLIPLYFHKVHDQTLLG